MLEKNTSAVSRKNNACLQISFAGRGGSTALLSLQPFVAGDLTILIHSFISIPSGGCQWQNGNILRYAHWP